MKRYAPDTVRAQIDSVLNGLGADESTRAICTEVMYDTDLMGVDSHGISMLPYYASEIENGNLLPTAQPEVAHAAGAVARIDGMRAFGHTGAHLAMTKAIEAAKSFGVGIGVVNRTNHYGAAGYYARMAAEAGLMGISLCSTANALQIPHGAKYPLMGTNPIAFAAPVPGEDPVLVDMATSVVPLNKVKVYGLKGEPLPAEWVADPDGRPIYDAGEVYERLEFGKDGGVGLLPLGGATFFGGGHKGSALATMVQILSAALPGAGQPGNVDGYQDIGYFFLAIDPAFFGAPVDASDYVRELRETIRGMEPTDPAAPVQATGDRDFLTRAEREAHGIPLADALVEKLRDLCTRFDAEFTLTEQQ
ncbi:Ldh family oxidoreductase [Brevibacterium album]|uniref:Ldh family oxidoreductase n=1 Tax=Brevibacterium album TaxID=417948 RepID=UPI0003FDCB71|nr:Ldh family oxidoreductase [Brevibacterium album]